MNCFCSSHPFGIVVMQTLYLTLWSPEEKDGPTGQ